jgi:hypothetical protein
MSTNNSNTSVPGLLLPTQKAMPAGSPGASVIQSVNQSNQKLLNLQKIGGKARKLRKKRGGAITVPQFTMSYSPQGGTGQDPNSIISQNAGVGTQAAANSVYDNQAKQMGGHYNMNTNPYQWGCYSGGKKKRTKRTTRTRKTRKSRKSRKSRKHRMTKSKKYRK